MPVTFPLTKGSARLSFTARVQRRKSATARCASKEDHQPPALFLPSNLVRLAFSGPVPVSGLTAAVERAHSYRARSGSKRPTWVPVLPPMRGPPRIERAAPALSEPLNLPQLSFTFSPFQRRHSGCSSNYPTGRADRGWERRWRRPTQYPETLPPQ